MKNKFSLPQISVSILNSDLCNIKEVVKTLEQLKINFIHLDVMDGHFVPNLTFGIPVVKCIRSYTERFLDVHLMIDNPIEYIKEYINSQPNILTFHYEAVKSKNEILRIVETIKKAKILAGISIKPTTPVKKIFPYLNHIDLVLVMTVEPGFGGQKILSNCLNKISVLREHRDKHKLNFIISADGGINEHNIREILSLGCDLPVVGNAIFGSSDISKKIKLFRTLTLK